MTLQSVVNDLKTRVDTLASQGQEVAKGLPDTFKQANEVLVSGVQTLVKTETETAKDLLAVAKASFEKARTDGLKAVAADPISYLPAKGKFISAFNETVELVSKTGDELYKTFKTGLTPAVKTAAAANESDAVAKTSKPASKKKTTVKKTSSKSAE